MTFDDFELIALSEETLIISTNRTSKTRNPMIFKILSSIKKDKITEDLLYKEIKKLNLPHKETMSFLLKSINLRKDPDQAWFDKVIILNDGLLTPPLMQHIAEAIDPPVEYTSKISEVARLAKNYVSFILLTPQNMSYTTLKHFYFEIAYSSTNSAICVGYIQAEKYCLSAPFIPEIGNPCHFCSLDRIIGLERTADSESGWPKLLKLCKDNNISMPARELDILESSLVAGSIIKKIKFYMGHSGSSRHQTEAFNSLSIDLRNGSILEESTPHWAMCDCITLRV